MQGVFPFPDGNGWCGEAAAALSCVELGLQPGEPHLPLTAMILSTKQPGNGGIWLGHSLTGKI